MSGQREEDETQERREDEVFAGPWWKFRPFQGAGLSGVLLVLGYSLSRLSVISEAVAIAFYVAAIPPGAFYWLREGLEELVKERTLGDSLSSRAGLPAWARFGWVFR